MASTSPATVDFSATTWTSMPSCFAVAAVSGPMQATRVSPSRPDVAAEEPHEVARRGRAGERDHVHALFEQPGDQLRGGLGRHCPVGYHVLHLCARLTQAGAELVPGDVGLRQEQPVARGDVAAQRLRHGRGDGLPRHEVRDDAAVPEARRRGFAYRGDPGFAQGRASSDSAVSRSKHRVYRVSAGEHGPSIPREVADGVVQLGRVLQRTDLDGGRLDGLGPLERQQLGQRARLAPGTGDQHPLAEQWPGIETSSACARRRTTSPMTTTTGGAIPDSRALSTMSASVPDDRPLVGLRAPLY